MISISLKFLAGRYHATPWGRHVNEGAVEWPPSPWRILRALVATWKRTLPDLPRDRVEPILRALATPPEFALPPASTGHTRHYMPWDKGWKHDKQHPRTLVFDTFVAVSRESHLVIRWPNALLDASQHDVLGRILGNLNTLGRSESWCEASLAATPLDQNCVVCRPIDGNASRDHEIVRLLCPDPASAFECAEFTNRSKKKTKRTAPPYEPDWHLCAETLWLHKGKWSDPPGSKWVPYARPRECFKIKTQPRPRVAVSHCCIQVARFALDSSVLPLITETLPVAEAARRALMSIHGRLTEQNDVRGRSAIFSGKDGQGRPLAGHGHAYYLPTDEDGDGDGRLDHLTVFARDGFGPDERRAFDRLRKLNTGRSGEESHPLRMLLVGTGTLDEYAPGPLGASSVWVSATPYIATRHAKTRGRNRVDLRSPQARTAFLVNDLRSQLQATFSNLPAEQVQIESVIDGSAFMVARRWRPIQFKRFRRKASDDGGRRLAGAFRLTFPVNIAGPIALGHSSHFGMGLFLPEGGTRA